MRGWIWIPVTALALSLGGCAHHHRSSAYGSSYEPAYGGAPYGSSYGSGYGGYAYSAPAQQGRVQAIEAVGDGRGSQASGAGALVGGVVGGVLGNQVGRGNGRAAATVIGALGGALIGNEMERQQSAPRGGARNRPRG